MSQRYRTWHHRQQRTARHATTHHGEHRPLPWASSFAPDDGAVFDTLLIDRKVGKKYRVIVTSTESARHMFSQPIDACQRARVTPACAHIARATDSMQQRHGCAQPVMPAISYVAFFPSRGRSRAYKVDEINHQHTIAVNRRAGAEGAGAKPLPSYAILRQVGKVRSGEKNFLSRGPVHMSMSFSTAHRPAEGRSFSMAHAAVNLADTMYKR